MTGHRLATRFEIDRGGEAAALPLFEFGLAFAGRLEGEALLGGMIGNSLSRRRRAAGIEGRLELLLCLAFPALLLSLAIAFVLVAVVERDADAARAGRGLQAAHAFVVMCQERLKLRGRIAYPERQHRALDIEALCEQHLTGARANNTFFG